MRFTDEIAKLIEQALARFRPPAGSILGQLAGTQVAPAASGSPGVVDRDDLVELSDDAPAALGSADAGDADTASRADHVHAHGDLSASGGTMHAAGQVGDLPEAVQDIVGAMVAAGANITATYNDGAGTLTIAVTGIATGYPSLSGLTAGQVLRATGASAAAFGALDLADADAITGDLPDANLSSNVPLKNAANTFTQAQNIGSLTPDGYALLVELGLHVVNPKSGGVTLLIESTSSGANPVISCANDAGVVSNFYTARSGAGNAGETVLQNVAGNPIFVTPYLQMSEVSAPAAPAANGGRLFLRDNGAGKTQLCVIFNTGAIQVIATQP